MKKRAASPAIFLESRGDDGQIARPMKILAAMFCCLLALLPASVRAGNPAHRSRQPALAERDYVSLRDWAADNHLKVSWVQRNKIIALTNATQRLVFTVNSTQAEINGVNVWLSHPVAAGDATGPCLTRFDLHTAIQPLVSPPRNTPGKKLKLIVLDPGHGGKDTGNCVGSQAEKKYTLLLAQEIRDQLKKSGIKVAFTRSTDTFVELPARPAKAQKLGADLFLSLHFNAVREGRAEVHGSEVYCLTPAGASSTNTRGEGNPSQVTGNRNNDKSLFLAYQIQKSLGRNLHAEDRGVRRARFAVLRDATMPAALIEAGFMSHPAEGGKIFTAAYRREMARAIVNGILAYKREVERV